MRPSNGVARAPYGGAGGAGAGAARPSLVAAAGLASLFVLFRLWASAAEAAHWRGEAGRLGALAAAQRRELAAGAADAAAAAGPAAALAAAAAEPAFYSVRPAPALGAPVPPLRGQLLVNDPLPLAPPGAADAPLGGVDAVEAGVVTGWACAPAGGPGADRLLVSVYVDGVRAATAEAAAPAELPGAAAAEAARACGGSEDDEGGGGGGTGAPALAFAARLPPLAAGRHELRVFAAAPAGPARAELLGSPAALRESAARPDAEEALRRKDALIVARNAELVRLYDDVRTRVPWREAAAAAGGELAAAVAFPPNATAPPPPAVAVLLHSAAHARGARDAARRAWVAACAARAPACAARFVLGRPRRRAERAALAAEALEHGDMILTGEPEGPAAAPRRVLAALAAALAELPAATLLAISHGGVVVNANALLAFAAEHAALGNVYAGCFKSGEVVADSDKPWYEPEHARFGEPAAEGSKMQYPRHAGGTFYAFSRPLAAHLARARAVLQSYANEDTSVGAWLLGLAISPVDDARLCCELGRAGCGEPPRPPGRACVAVHEGSCPGVCDPEHSLEGAYRRCVLGEGLEDNGSVVAA
jgi:hypothetical protein